MDIFQIDAKPTDDEDYNRIHAQCESIASGVVMFVNPDGKKIIGIFRMYRDFIERNLEQVDGEIAGERFIAWLQSAAEQRGETPDEWEMEMFEALDELFIDAIQQDDLTPMETFALYEQYVEEATEEFEQIHNLEGFFDDVE